MFRILWHILKIFYYSTSTLPVPRTILGHYQGWTNLLLRARIFGRASKIDQARRKMGAQNESQCACLIEKYLETFLFFVT